MEFTGVGGGIMLALAAALWLAYLVPSWFRRREYLATERNAVRLQQTIRVLAESAEMPDAVRAHLEAKQLAQAQRLELREGPVAVGPVRRPLPSEEEAKWRTARRLRRTRAVAFTSLVFSLVVTVAQVALIIGSGAVVGSWVVLAASATGALVGMSVLGRLAPAQRRQTGTVTPRPRRVTMSDAPAARVTPAAQDVSWTPTAVPTPLYLTRSVAPAAAASPTELAARLRAAAVSAEHAVRTAQRDVPSVASQTSGRVEGDTTVARGIPTIPAAATTGASVPAAAPSRFARMGIVDDAATAIPDLDAVLARRRAAG